MEYTLQISPLLAYFDPGSGSLVLQAVVGGAAGLLVFAKYVWTTAAPRFFRSFSERSNIESVSPNQV